MVEVSFKTQQQLTSWDEIRMMWEAADEIEELVGGWLFDHFMPINTAEVDGPCLEGWTALSVLAGLTSRLRLGLMVSSVTYRHPAVIANMAATLDIASGGRLELGLGAGWFEREYRAYGIEFFTTKERLERLDEACEVIHLLMTKDVSDFRGKHYRLEAARCDPKPLQQPRPPFVIGGGGEQRTLRTVARWGDHWNFPGSEPDDLRQKLGVLHERCAEIGRDPSEIVTSVHLFLDGREIDVARQSRNLAQAGADHLILYLFPPYDPETLRQLAQQVADAVS